MTKDCKFCDKKGLMILPLRYSVATADDTGKELGAIPALPGNLGEGVKDLALTHGKYVPALLRLGYLYVLIEHKGIKSWDAYYVTGDAYLYKFPAETPPDTSKIEFSCDPASCGIDASMVSIDKASDVEKVYFLFTPDPLTKAKLKEYKADPEGMVAKKKMQLFNPKAWLTGNTQQPHALVAEEARKHAREWILYGQAERALDSPLGLALGRQLFAPINAAFAGVSPKDGKNLGQGRLAALYQNMQQRKAAAFVLYDHIGITQELNQFRNAALDEIRPWLERTDSTAKATNERKLHILSALDDVRKALENGAVTRQKEFQEGGHYLHETRDRGAANTAQQLRAMGRIADAEKVERDAGEHIARRNQNAIQNQKQAQIQAWEKYAKKLQKLDPFREEMQRETQKHDQQLLSRVDDHQKWLTDERLLAAFDAYDKQHVPNGQAFQDAVGLAIHGMNYTQAGWNVVLKWAEKNQVSRDNLLLRAYALNQQDIEQATNQALAAGKATAEKAGAEYAYDGQTHWWKTLDLLQANWKNVTDAFDKANAALGEIAETHPFRSHWLGAGMAIYSTMGQAVFKVGLNGRASWLAGLYTAGMAATLGRFASSIRLSELAHADSPPVNLPNQRRSESQGVRRVREAIEHQIAEGARGEIYKLRLAGLLAIIEAFGLCLRWSKKDQDTKANWEFRAAALAVGGAAFEVLGTGIEYSMVRYGERSMTARGAAVVLGGTKLLAGALAAVGAGVGVVYDVIEGMEARDRKNYPLAYTLYARSFSQACAFGSGVLAGYSFSAPLFEHLAIRVAATRRGAAWVAGRAAAMALRRALLLRVFAMATWATIALSIILFYITNDALEDWCEKSSFRKNPKKDDSTFTNEGEELGKLYQAFEEVK